MEQAVFISEIDGLRYCDARFSRLYFGNEFCEQLIPSTGDLERALGFVSETALNFTLVTPYVTDKGLGKLEALFENAAKMRPGSEVVFNDYGVLQVLKGRYPQLKPVMGRLLNRMKRGPRLMMIMDKLPRTAVDYFRRSNLTVPALVNFLKESRVERVELDNALQGIGFKLEGLKGSLYIPYAYITTTRLCLTNGCDKPGMEGRIGIFPCAKECRKYTFYLRHPIMPDTLIRKGNTIFHLNESIDPDIGEKGIDRLVVQPVIPM